MWIANYAAKIANGIKNLVVSDTPLFDLIYELTDELFDIIVVSKAAKNGIMHIKPFELMWTRKCDLVDKFGGSIYTEQFFIQNIINFKTIS